MRSHMGTARGLGLLLAAVLALPLPATAANASAAAPQLAATSGRAAADPALFTTIHAPTPAADAPRAGRRYADGVVLVGFEPGAAKADRANAGAQVRASARSPVSPLAVGLEKLTLPAGVDAETAARTLRRHPAVRFAQPDYVLRPDVLPNDPGYAGSDLWGLYGPATEPAAAYGSNAAGAWLDGHLGSRSVVVGIVDTGVQISHPDLAPNIWTNPFETPGNGVDDDGNGYVDDVHGWDFYNDDSSVFDGWTDWHGTHVAGTIGGVGGNRAGVVGVNWAVTMIPTKFIQGEGFSSDAIAALDYLTDLKVRHGLNLVATNNSYGGHELQPALRDAINRGGDAGILFVASAGNDGVNTDVTPVYPSAYGCTTRFDTGLARGFDCLISVAAIDVNGARPSFSNYGAATVDLGAPGVDVVSTYPTNLYTTSNGTSMASPHVTGALALLASCQAAPTASALRATLLSSVAPTGSMAGRTSSGGRLDVGAMTVACSSSMPPRALFSVPPGYVTGTTTAVELWLSGDVDDLTVADLAVGGTSTGWSVGTITGSGAGPYRVTLAASNPTDGTLTISLKPNSVTADEVAGPAVAEVAPRLVVDRRAPSVSTLTTKVALGASAACPGVPLRLSWTGNDFGGSGIVRFELAQSINGGPFSNISTTLTSPSATISVGSTGSRRFRVRAVDAAGRPGAYLTGTVVTPRLTPESSSAVDYSSGWTTTSSSVYCGGAVRRATLAGRSATFAFTGRGVAVLSTLAPNRGKARIYVDGVFAAQVDLVSASTRYKRVIWERTWAAPGAHTVKVVVAGTAGRPRIDMDGFVVLK